MNQLKQELTAVNENHGWYDASEWQHFRLSGKDTSNFLHRLLPCHIQAQNPGTGTHSAMLDRKGKVQTLFYLIKLADNMVQALAPKLAANAAIEMLQKYILSEDVEIQNVSTAYQLFSIFGPQSRTLLADFAHSEIEHQISKQADGSLIWRDDLYQVPTWHIMATRLMSEKYRQIFATNSYKISAEALKILRLKANIPEFGIDIGPANILLEGNTAHTFARQKGCYPGQEVIERLLSYAEGNTPKIIASFMLEGEQTIEENTSVSSFAYDPTTNKTLLMATIKRKDLAPQNWQLIS